MQKLQAEVHANLSDDSYTVPQLCEAIGMSRTQLHNKIKALTGFSTTIFIRTVRLQKAKELILHSQLTISEIAYEVGFVDPSYFSRKFAEEFGDRPSSMRK
jgi:AraC-like DNA-binding protein